MRGAVCWVAGLILAMAASGCASEGGCGGGTIVIGGCLNGEVAAPGGGDGAAGGSGDAVVRLFAADTQERAYADALLSGPVTQVTSLVLGIGRVELQLAADCDSETRFAVAVSESAAWTPTPGKPAAQRSVTAGTELCAVDLIWAAGAGGLDSLAVDGRLADGRALSLRSQLAGGTRVLPETPIPVTAAGLDVTLAFALDAWLEPLGEFELTATDGLVRVDATNNNEALGAVEARIAFTLQTQPATTGSKGAWP